MADFLVCLGVSLEVYESSSIFDYVFFLTAKFAENLRKVLEEFFRGFIRFACYGASIRSSCSTEIAPRSFYTSEVFVIKCVQIKYVWKSTFPLTTIPLPDVSSSTRQPPIFSQSYA